MQNNIDCCCIFNIRPNFFQYLYAVLLTYFKIQMFANLKCVSNIIVVECHL